MDLVTILLTVGVALLALSGIILLPFINGLKTKLSVSDQTGITPNTYLV